MMTANNNHKFMNTLHKYHLGLGQLKLTASNLYSTYLTTENTRLKFINQCPICFFTPSFSYINYPQIFHGNVSSGFEAENNNFTKYIFNKNSYNTLNFGNQGNVVL